MSMNAPLGLIIVTWMHHALIPLAHSYARVILVTMETELTAKILTNVNTIKMIVIGMLIVPTFIRRIRVRASQDTPVVVKFAMMLTSVYLEYIIVISTQLVLMIMVATAVNVIMVSLVMDSCAVTEMNAL